MTISNRKKLYMNIPVEFNMNENFQNDIPADRLFLGLVAKGSISIKINDQHSVFMGPCAILLNDSSRIEYIASHMLEAKSLSFDYRFINSDIPNEKLQNNDYSDFDDEFDYVSLRPFFSKDKAFIHCIPLGITAYNSISELMDTIGKTLISKSDDRWVCRCKSSLIKICLMLDEIYNEYMTAKKPSGFPRDPDLYVPIVLEYIHTRYPYHISVKELCELVSVNKTTLNINFKERTGHSLNDYIIDYRLKVAAKILRFTDLTIEDVSSETGFKYGTYFIRMFVNKFGMSPTDFRKKI